MNVKISGTIVILVLLILCATFFKWGFERIQKRRCCELDKVMHCELDKVKHFAPDKAESIEKSKKSYLPAVFHSTTKKPMPETVGLVKGIVYSKNKSSTIISDNNDIVYEDNTIHGVKIVKIHKDKVEFAKNGQRWTQKVGETPNPGWYN